MSKIFCLMGKSATGKDSIYQELFQRKELDLKRIIPYTTRPIRQGEEPGREYYFCGEDQVQQMQEQGKIIELRAYHTVYGIWKYFTANDGQIDLTKNDYLLIGTLETFQRIRDYFGKDQVIPIYVEVEDGERLTRALMREKEQEKPKYTEMCRRFLADDQDFSESNLVTAGVNIRFQNQNLSETIQNVSDYIKEVIAGGN